MIIYECKNKIDGKAYIGQTTRTLEIRKEEHRNSIVEEGFKHLPFYRALKKHGWENFIWRIVDETAKTTDELDELEKFYIKKLNTLAPNGYNSTLGGDSPGGWNKGLTKETDERIARHSAAMTGRVLSEENLKNVREANQRPERKAKISKAMKGKSKPEGTGAKISAAKKNKTYEEIYGIEGAEKQKVKLSAAKFKNWKDPDYRKNQSIARKGKKMPKWTRERRNRVKATWDLKKQKAENGKI